MDPRRLPCQMRHCAPMVHYCQSNEAGVHADCLVQPVYSAARTEDVPFVSDLQHGSQHLLTDLQPGAPNLLDRLTIRSLSDSILFFPSVSDRTLSPLRISTSSRFLRGIHFDSTRPLGQSCRDWGCFTSCGLRSCFICFVSLFVAYGTPLKVLLDWGWRRELVGKPFPS